MTTLDDAAAAFEAASLAIVPDEHNSVRTVGRRLRFVTRDDISPVSFVTPPRDFRHIPRGPHNPRIYNHIPCPACTFLLAPPVPFNSARLERAEITLKITINENETTETVTLRLEGRIARPWFAEFQKAWDGLAASLGSRKLVVDLCGVTQMCPEARELLAGIYARTGAQFQADTPLTKYFAEEAQNLGLARKRGTGTKEKAS